jgi:hypothetical protein
MSDVQDSPHQPIPPLVHTFTPKEVEFIQKLMTVTPTGFLQGCTPGFDTNIRLLGMGSLALSDLNLMPPCTQYNFETLPPQLHYLLILGTQAYMMLMFQAGFSLVDISYSDNGFSLTIDRAGKVASAYEKVLAMWERQLLNYKHCLLLKNGGVGLGTPRFQSNLSRMIGMLTSGGAFGWGMP